MRRLAALLVVLGCVAFVAPSANAHVLKSDGTIGAVLHIEPDDNPTSGRLTSYDLAFKDTTGRFKLPICACSVTILQNRQAIFSQNLALTGDLTSQDSFTFPEADVYTLEINGRPTKAGAFQPFSLNYLVRVTGGGVVRSNQPVPMLLRFGLSLTIALVLLGVYAVVHTSGNRRNKEPL
jgi:hypothetical protein